MNIELIGSKCYINSGIRLKPLSYPPDCDLLLDFLDLNSFIKYEPVLKFGARLVFFQNLLPFSFLVGRLNIFAIFLSRWTSGIFSILRFQFLTFLQMKRKNDLMTLFKNKTFVSKIIYKLFLSLTDKFEKLLSHDVYQYNSPLSKFQELERWHKKSISF